MFYLNDVSVAAALDKRSIYVCVGLACVITTIQYSHSYEKMDKTLHSGLVLCQPELGANSPVGSADKTK